ncbi:MAG: Chaperone for flagella basal body P-ring formation [Chlamydiales bacterium]|jgi:flagella basal body P-ring formation protein FlgA|nr:Chaperone for flagella basal body P-ring formation [Chlamydiales bacterium]
MRMLMTILALFFTPLFGAALPAKTVIRLTAAAEVEAAQIQLKSIALVESCEEAIKEKLLEAFIAKSPGVGSKKTLYPYQIQAALQKKGFGAVEVLGPHVEVELKTRVLSSDDIKELVWQKVKESVGDRDVELRFLKESEWEIPARSLDLEVTTSSQKLLGNILFTVRAREEEQEVAALQVKTYIALFEPVALLKRPILKQEKVTEDDVTFTRQEVTKLDGMQIASYTEIEKMVAKRNLPKNVLLKRNDFELPILVKQGDPCRIVVVNGPIRMAITGATALKNGREGDVIPFTNPMQPGRTLNARCLNEKVALIQIQ